MNKIIRSILFVSVGLIFFGSVCYFAPDSFKDSYQTAFVRQYDYYRGMKEQEKILVLGGSSVAFGIDLDVMEAKTERPCAEFGVHLDMGYSLLMEASKCNLHSGDVVVIEFFDRSLSDFGVDLILAGLGRRTDIYRYFLPRFWSKVAVAVPRYIEKCYFYNFFPYQDNGYNGIYFDERGCMTTLRDEKNLHNIDKSMNEKASFSYPDNFDNDFMEYLNDYVNYCRSIGVKVFFTYPPYMKEKYDWNNIDFKRYDEELASKLPAPLITNLEDAIYPQKYIWNHPRHLNTEGAKIRSERLAEALKPYLDSELK